MFKRSFLLLSCFFTLGLSAQQGWSLQQCIEHAFKNNISILQSDVNSKISEVSYNQSKANILPTLNAGATHTYNIGKTIDRYTNTFADAAVLSQNFYLGTQVTLWSGLTQYNTIKQNQYTYLAAKETVEQRKNDLALNVATNFLQVIYNEEMIKIAQSQYDMSKEQLDRTIKLVEAGSLAKSNEYDVKAQLANDDFTLVSAKNNYGLAMLSLKQLLNLDTLNSFAIAKPDFSEPDANIANISVYEVYQTALKNQHNIKSAEFSLLSSEKSLAAARGRISPTLSFSGSIGTGYSGLGQRVVSYTPTGLYNVYATSGGVPVMDPTEISVPNLEKTPFADQFKDNVNKSLGFTLNVPLFNGLSTYSSVKTAQLQSLNAKYTYDLTKQQLFKTISQAHADAQASFNKYNSAKLAQDAAEQSFTYAKQKYDVGAISAFEFNSAKNRLLKSQSDVLNSKYDYIFKLKVLDFYQGKPLY
ncbi:MAG: TolC family protein [Bacteroidota bacterium]|nr:TolC family protein [Bacteroidota bacterium]